MSLPLALVGLLVAGASDAQVHAGRILFNDPGVGKNGVACSDCHATVDDEDRTGDGLIRSGQSLWGVTRRPFWRGDVRRQLHARVADAVDVCVQLFQGGKPLNRLQRRNMTAYLSSISPRAKRPRRKTSPSVAPRIRTALEADGNYDRPKYRNGNPDRGRGLFYRACHRCHPHGQAGVAPAVAGATVGMVAGAIREGNGLLRGARRPGAWSPFFGLGRLTNAQVADIAAFVGALAPLEAHGAR